MFSQVRAFPISAFVDGKPTISTGYPLLATEENEQEINNVSVSLAPVNESREYRADDKVQRDEVTTSYDGTITAYGIDADFLSAVTVNRKDSEGKTILVSSSKGNPAVVLFYKGRNSKGKKYCAWLFNVEFANPSHNAGQEESSPTTLELTFTATSVTYNGELTFGNFIYEGEDGYIADGVEPTAADLRMPS